MTVQIGDIYKYQSEDYSLVALSEGSLFDPFAHGLSSHPSCTACHRGYWCEYELRENALYLKNLYLFNKDGYYPPLNGIDISPQEFIERECRSNGHTEKVLRPANWGHRTYKDVAIPIKFTGKILIGRFETPTYHVEGIWDNPWRYKELLELIFDNGMLVNLIDQSETAKDIRKIIRTMPNSKPESRGTMGTFVRVNLGVLTLISDNAWWISNRRLRS